MAWLGLATALPTLTIEFADQDANVWFLYPGPPELEPIGDTNVEGRVVLDLPTAKLVRNVSLLLLGQSRFRIRGKEHRVETFRREVSLNVNEEELSAGTHYFAFSLNIPATIAPSLYSDELGEMRYRLFATIPKLGRLGGELQTRRRIAFQVNHSGRYNGPPPPCHFERQFVHPRFGPSLFQLSSKYLIIGGFVRWYINWTAFTLPFKILEMTLEIVQDVRIKPSLGTVEPCEKRELRFVLYKFSEDDTFPSRFKEVIRPGDEGMRYSRQARIPIQPDAYIVPSHHPDSHACLSATSKVVLQLTFEQYEGGETPTLQQFSRPQTQLLEISCPAVLSSCFCRVEYSKLPAYTATEDTSLSRQNSREIEKGIRGFSQCMCSKLDESKEREYGLSRDEVEKQWKEEEAAGQAWIEMTRHKEVTADEAGATEES